MALIQYFADDIDGTQGEDVKPRKVLLPDGLLTMDLSDANYEKLSKAIVTAVRKVVTTDKFDKFYAERADADVSENAIIRNWARAQRNPDGTPMYEVNVRGRIAEDIVTAYRKSLAGNGKSESEANDNADKASEAVNALVNA